MLRRFADKDQEHEIRIVTKFITQTVDLLSGDVLEESDSLSEHINDDWYVAHESSHFSDDDKTWKNIIRLERVLS